jgi:pimeloyl-ACP methyl ester carboxylesterase
LNRSALEEAEQRAFARYGLVVTTRFVQLSDPPVAIRVLETGDGPPVILLGGPSASTWAPLMAGLVGHRLLAIDRPGCGLSGPFDYTGIDLRRHAVQLLSGVIDALDVRDPGFVGNSLGGLWGFWLALDRPDLLASLAQLGCPALLLDTSAPLAKRMRSVQGLNRIGLAPSKRTVLERMTDSTTDHSLPAEMRECLYRANLQWATGRTYLSLVERTLTLNGARPGLSLHGDDLADLTLPVLFLWGDHDDYGSPDVGRRACTYIEGAELRVLQAGHFPWLDRPSECVAALMPFLRSASLRPQPVRRAPDPDPATPGREVIWLRQILWDGSRNGAPDQSDSADRAPGARRYAIFPSPARPLVLAPLATREVASATLRHYNALRPPLRRLARSTLALGLRFGLLQPLLPDRGVLRVGGGGSTADLLDTRLQDVFGVREVVMAISLGRLGPFRKPMIQAMTPRGKVLGYVKVGWSDLTRRLIQNEARTLAWCATAELPGILIPTLIHSGSVGPLEICVTAPLPPSIRRYRRSDAHRSVPAMLEVASLRRSEALALGRSVFWSRVRARVQAVAGSDTGRTADTLVRFTDGLEGQYGDHPVLLGFWHGDWVPWNLGWAEGHLVAWDWEHAGPDVPVGFDILHHLFQVAFIARGKPFAEAAALSRAAGLSILEAVGVPPGAGDLVFKLYLLEIFLRFHEPWVAGAGRDRRFHPPLAARVFEETPATPIART